MTHSPLRLVAIDLGAESGRAVVGTFDGGRMALQDVHRFANLPVALAGTLQWDFLRLFGDVIAGLRWAAAGGPVASVGVDTWGVDFGLLDERGRLLGNPVHYRDARTVGMPDLALPTIPREEIYRATGIQFHAHQHALPAALDGPRRRSAAPPGGPPADDERPLRPFPMRELRCGATGATG